MPQKDIIEISNLVKEVKMARQTRVHYEGALYHVICRGNNREWVFTTNDQKQRYIDFIRKYKDRFGFKLYAWVVMSNHVHLLIEVGKAPLSKIMQGLQQSYTQWYNRNNQRVGHVFEQRYKAIHCNKDAYLLNLLRYIHQNPVRVNLEGGLDYQWSSHRVYKGQIKDGITDITFPLSLFSEQAQRAVPLYLEFMDEEEDLFTKIKVSELQEGTQEADPNLTEKALCAEPLNQIAAVAQEILKIDDSELFSRRRHLRISQCRRLIIQFCNQHTNYSQKDLAKFLGITQPAVAMAIGDAAFMDKYLDVMINKLCIDA